jgi:hypothetical protein
MAKELFYVATSRGRDRVQGFPVDTEGPNMAHELPEVMSVWESMGKLCEARDGRPPMEFPHVERIQIAFER